ncbi:hypothetical protein EVAR_56130_1 [Eumeta japonica]|uniref:Uncharacterized protein n=1 Tax=Eumeta variegata TaxID=151549 RepID=A0A4C1Z264_EUMVA|nr:hypothetical protein EVAR_56130_1 [Eumeta japonica]
MNAVEMRSLRNMCKGSRQDRCRKSDVRERCGLKEDVVARAERGMLRWFSHLGRMNGSRLTKQICRGNLYDGNVGKGRLRKFYANHFGGITKKGKILSTQNQRACIKRLMDVSDARQICKDRIM